MMLSVKNFINGIDFTHDKIPVIIIENKSFFRNVFLDFKNDNSDELFVFSEDFKPFEFSKKGVFISDPLSFDSINKKLMTKVNLYLEETANEEYSVELSDIKSRLIDLGNSLVAYNEYDFDYNYDITTSSIIKLLDFKISNEVEQGIFLLLRRLLLISKYIGINLFVIPNLHLYFENNEILDFYRTLKLNHIDILVIENFESDYNSMEDITIIDKDLCVIDKSEIF